MPISPPLPMVQAFVVCREIFVSRRNGDEMLASPFSRVTVPRFPAALPMGIYAHLTGARGRYEVSFRLVEGPNEVVWSWDKHCTVEEHDPLLPHRILLNDVVVEFPRPGRFDLIMVANGAPLAQHALWARQGPVA